MRRETFWGYAVAATVEEALGAAVGTATEQMYQILGGAALPVGSSHTVSILGDLPELSEIQNLVGTATAPPRSRVVVSVILIGEG